IGTSLFSIDTVFSLASSRSAAPRISVIAVSRWPSDNVIHAAAACFWIRVCPAQYSSLAEARFVSISSRWAISARAAPALPERAGIGRARGAERTGKVGDRLSGCILAVADR